MLKKIVAYQRMLLSGWALSRSASVKITIGFLLYVIMGTVFDIFSCIAYDFLVMLAFFMLIYFQDLIENHTSPYMRSIPASDRFAVANYLFVLPIVMVFDLVAITLGAIFVLLALIQRISFISLFVPGLTHMQSIMGIMFYLLLFIGFWFLLCLQAFQPKRFTRNVWYGSIIVLFIAINIILSYILRQNGFNGSYLLSDIPLLFPTHIVMVSTLLFAVLCGAIAWNRCLTLYHANNSNQPTSRYAQWLEHSMPVAESNEGIKPLTVAGIVGPLLLIGIALSLGHGLFDGGGQPHYIETHSASDYDDWESYIGQTGIPGDLAIIDSGLVLFPETVDDKSVDEYYACADITYDASANGARLLAVSLSDASYQEEIDRLSSVTLTYNGQTNEVLTNTELFATRAYIALFIDSQQEYEYALCDDTTRQIIYVFCENNNLDQMPTTLAYKPTSYFAVIPPTQFNGGERGFSLYSFWNEEDHFYENWWPGKEKV